jgi:type IV fimbrial biogenesis protein FimT
MLSRPFATRSVSRPISRAGGFTLIEVLIVVAISAILLAVAVPAFNQSIARAQARDAAQTLHATLQLARSEAIRRSVQVSVCRVTNSGAGRPPCDNTATADVPAGDWASGWVVFAEEAPGGAVGVLDAADDIVLVQQPLAGAGGTRAELVHPATLGLITFSPVGVITGGATVSFAIAFPQAALGAPQRQHQVVANLAGQIRVTGY